MYGKKELAFEAHLANQRLKNNSFLFSTVSESSWEGGHSSELVFIPRHAHCKSSSKESRCRLHCFNKLHHHQRSAAGKTKLKRPQGKIEYGDTYSCSERDGSEFKSLPHKAGKPTRVVHPIRS